MTSDATSKPGRVRTSSALLNPSSVCIIGASADRTRVAGRVLPRLVQHNFPGDVYLVNPNRREIDGRACYPSVRELPGSCDVALVALEASKVPDVVADCGSVGIKNVVVLSSGFEEVESGAGLADRLRSVATEHGVAVIGPNCEGIWSIPARMTLTFGSAANRASLIPGPVSVISQSGSIGGACMRELQDRGIGCRYFFSTGNETVTSAMDVLELLVAEGGSGVIALFLEGLRDGGKLRELAQEARRQGTALVALRGGLSNEGRLASMSHTGRVATAARVYADVLRQAQVLDVETFTQLLDAIELATARLDDAGRPASPGMDSGVGILAISGGSRALLADACARRGVPLARFEAATEQKLAAVLPRFGSSKNPADVTADVLSDPELFVSAADLVAADRNTDMVLVQYANGVEAQIHRHIEVVTGLRQLHAKPFVFSFLGGVSDQLAVLLRRHQIPFADDPAEAISRLGWLSQLREDQPGGALPAAGRAGDMSSPASGSWLDACRFLSDAGIEVARWSIVPESWTGGLPEGIRFPVAVKALPEHAAHKTERDLFALDLRNDLELSTAAARIRERLGQEVPLLVQEMVSGGLEMLLAVVDDQDFGPVLAMGFGGLLTEWVDDIGYVQLPATRAEIRAALERLRMWRLLQPFRGRPAGDVDAVLDAAERLSNAYLSTKDSGWEIELNPVLVLHKGVVVVDVLTIIDGTAQRLSDRNTRGDKR